ncbi:hypothetical protein [Streptomyces sp. CS62]|uniref:hypothetical protein n=1 Tax=Streptomyces sp. CS62 TaxID=3119268 RepID=UPI002F955D94
MHQVPFGPGQPGPAAGHVVADQAAGRGNQARGSAGGVLGHPGEGRGGGGRCAGRPGEQRAHREVPDGLGRGVRPFAAGGRLLHRLGGPAARRVPAGGPAVQQGLQGGLPAAEPPAQHRREQGVHPEPPRPGHGFDECVAAHQVVQDGLAVGAPRQRGGQIRVHPPQHAAVQQQLAGGGGLDGEHLRQQVVGDGLPGGGRRAGKGEGVLGVRHGQGAQPQPGGPPLGAFEQQVDHAPVGGAAALRRLQEAGGLGAGEGEVPSADLRDPALHPVAVQRQPGLGPAEDDEPEGGTGVFHDEAEAGADVRAADPVEAVEDEDQRNPRFFEGGGDPHRQARIGAVAEAAADRHPAAAEPLHDVRPEGLRGVLLVQRQPHHGGGGRPRPRPGGDQRGLAAAGGPRDQRQGALRTAVEPPGQPLPAYQAGRRIGQSEFRTQHRGAHQRDGHRPTSRGGGSPRSRSCPCTTPIVSAPPAGAAVRRAERAQVAGHSMLTPRALDRHAALIARHGGCAPRRPDRQWRPRPVRPTARRSTT